jgi:hypothetical protein
VFGLIRITGVLKVLQTSLQQVCDLPRKEWRHRVPHLDISLCPVAKEQIVIRKGLQPGCFANGQTAALEGIWVDKIVAILRDVAGDRCRGLIGDPD